MCSYRAATNTSRLTIGRMWQSERLTGSKYFALSISLPRLGTLNLHTSVTFRNAEELPMPISRASTRQSASVTRTVLRVFWAVVVEC